MIMISKALLDHNPQPSRAEIAEALSGNLCRCTGYDPIIAAVQQAAGAQWRQPWLSKTSRLWGSRCCAVTA